VGAGRRLDFFLGIIEIREGGKEEGKEEGGLQIW